MMMKRLLVILGIMCISVMAAAQDAVKVDPDHYPSSVITGAWERSVGQEVWRLVLNPDGKGTLRGQSLTWKFNHGVLSLSGKGTILTYNATVTGNSLQLSGGSLQQPVVYDRVKSGSGLIGRWQNKEATLEIKGNGSVVINGETFRYTVHGDVITLSGTDGSVEIPFQLDGDTLITTFNGQRNVYARAAGSDSIGEGSGGSHPSELAGKWCYMSNVNANNGGSMSNRCITLYADGTYQYHSESSSSGQYGSTASEESDNGTWSATGTTITANSRNHGTLTYRLEKRNHPKTGDPMIVLDGDAYVTSTQRTPWQ